MISYKEYKQINEAASMNLGIAQPQKLGCIGSQLPSEEELRSEIDNMLEEAKKKMRKKMMGKVEIDDDEDGEIVDASSIKDADVDAEDDNDEIEVDEDEDEDEDEVEGDDDDGDGDDEEDDGDDEEDDGDDEEDDEVSQMKRYMKKSGAKEKTSKKKKSCKKENAEFIQGLKNMMMSGHNKDWEGTPIEKLPEIDTDNAKPGEPGYAPEQRLN